MLFLTVHALELREQSVSTDFSAGIDPRTICLLLMVVEKSYMDICMYLMNSAI